MLYASTCDFDGAWPAVCPAAALPMPSHTPSVYDYLAEARSATEPAADPPPPAHVASAGHAPTPMRAAPGPATPGPANDPPTVVDLEGCDPGPRIAVVASPALRECYFLTADACVSSTQYAILEALGHHQLPLPLDLLAAELGITMHTVELLANSLVLAGAVALVVLAHQSRRKSVVAMGAVLAAHMTDALRKQLPVTREQFLAKLATCENQTAYLGDLKRAITSRLDVPGWNSLVMGLVRDGFVTEFFAELDNKNEKSITGHCVRLISEGPAAPLVPACSMMQTVRCLLQAAGPKGMPLSQLVAQLRVVRGIAELAIKALGRDLIMPPAPWLPSSIFTLAAYADASDATAAPLASEVAPVSTSAKADAASPAVIVVGGRGRVRSLKEQAERRDRIMIAFVEEDRVFSSREHRVTLPRLWLTTWICEIGSSKPVYIALRS